MKKKIVKKRKIYTYNPPKVGLIYHKMVGGGITTFKVIDVFQTTSDHNGKSYKAVQFLITGELNIFRSDLPRQMAWNKFQQMLGTYADATRYVMRFGVPKKTKLQKMMSGEGGHAGVTT